MGSSSWRSEVQSGLNPSPSPGSALPRGAAPARRGAGSIRLPACRRGGEPSSPLRSSRRRQAQNAQRSPPVGSRTSPGGMLRRLLGSEIAQLLFLSASIISLTCLFCFWSSGSFSRISMVTAIRGQISSLVLTHPKRHPSGLARHRVWQPEA